MTSDASDRRERPLRGFLFMIAAVFFWGGSASLGKYLIVTRFDTLIIAQTRTTLAFLLLAIFFFVRKRSVFRVRGGDVWKLAALGIVGVAVTNYTYYFTVKEASVATAILVQYTAPVWVVLYSGFVARTEKIDSGTVIALVLGLIGCHLAVTGGSWHLIALKGWAAVTGPISAFTYAYEIVGTKELLKRYSVWTLLVYTFGFAALFWIFINPPAQILAKNYTAVDWGYLWTFAVVSILVPHIAFAYGLKLMDASTAGVIGILEPIFAIVIAFFALGETLGIVQSIGAFLVVGAVALLQAHPVIMRKVLKTG
jgi:drug/metabolite transporter (DMT)-like permease